MSVGKTRNPSMEKIPKNLGIKIGSKEEAFWTEIKDKLKEQTLTSQRQIIMNEHMLIFVEKKIAEEQRKGKSLNTAK